MLTTILEGVILLKSFLSFMNIALERLFVKYIIYVYIQSFLYILCLGTIPISRQLKDWVVGCVCGGGAQWGESQIIAK